MTAFKMTESAEVSNEVLCVKEMLENFSRAKILEVYFARVDGRIPATIPEEIKALYEIELEEIRAFLMGRRPEDSLLTRFLRLMN